MEVTKEASLFEITQGRTRPPSQTRIRDILPLPQIASHRDHCDHPPHFGQLCTLQEITSAPGPRQPQPG